MNCYVHNVPGRLRLKNPLFKNSEVHYAVKRALVEMGHGIGTAEFNATTGSLPDPLQPHRASSSGHPERLEGGYYQPEKAVTNDQVVHRRRPRHSTS